MEMCASNLAERVSYTLRILVGKHPEGVGIVDIVAVDGLTGHNGSTWTTRREDGVPVNWLQDLLPNRVQNARIMSISHDLGTQSSKYTSDIFIFADQLLEQLVGARTTSQEIARPIIFICHGLGGIIFKQALNKAHENNRYASVILPCIVGVAFFGTPHRSTDIAQWSRMLNRMLEASDLPTTVTSQLAKNFELDFGTLEHISKSFVDYGKKLKMFSFYETEKIDLMDNKVLETESATLDWPSETRIAANGNHLSMVWFTEDHEPRFEPVWMCINEMASNAIYLGGRYRLLQPAGYILPNLKSPDYKAQRERNPTAARGTCTWILGHPQYQSWLAEATSPFLLVSGDAGGGKSVLTSFLVDYHKRKQDSNVGYFFFRADNNEQREASYGLSALLHQLYTSQSELIQSAPNLLGEAGQPPGDLATLWHLITDATENPHARPTICFIDGLDECDEVSRKQLLNLMSEYFTTAIGEEKKKRGRQKKLKILVTTRPDNAIMNAFNRAEAAPMTTYNDRYQRIGVKKPHLAVLSLRGESETEAISKDIKLFVKDEMEKLGSSGQQFDILPGIEGELMSRGDMTFLWATLIIELLKRAIEGGVSHSDLEAIVKGKSTVYEIYAVLLNSKPDHYKARKMLSIILAALRPLTVEELSIALAISPDHQTFERSARPRRPSSITFDEVEQELGDSYEDHIKGLCGPFVQIIREKVYLVHQTARDFLLDPTSSEEFDEPIAMTEGHNSAWQHTFSSTNVHAVLLEICVTYLYMLGKRSRTCGLMIGEPSPKTSEFLKYAASSWTTHFGRIRHRIRRRDLPYYEGLCHPLFPGYRRWLDVFGLSTAELVGSADQIQDQLVQILELEPEDREARRRPRTTRERLLAAQGSVLSSSVATLGNSYFPVKVDENGFVSLDHSRSRAGHSSSPRARRN
ncbi:hypothetical protein GGR58DRAFT_473302 [Xylaria digitata]|nr:hypothetical protein GGR58DRAFT_473302 [Xylaria digitata]